MIAELKKNIDLVSIAESAGVEMKRSGARHVGPCPFHADRTPSFFVFPDNHYKCFGCGEHGDVISFVQKMYGLTFPDALKHLGIEQGEITPEIKEEIQRRKRERQEAEGFKAWEQAASAELHLLISSEKKVLQNIRTPSDLERFGPLFHNLTFWESCLQVLIYGDEKQKTRLYMDSVLTGEYQGDRFWNDSFNYGAWLREFQKRNADEWEIDLHFAGRETSSEEAFTSG